MEFLADPRLLDAFAIATTLAAAVAAGEAQARPPEGDELQLFIENDLLARTDRHCASGIARNSGRAKSTRPVPPIGGTGLAR